jgi:hypothetical protein
VPEEERVSDQQVRTFAALPGAVGGEPKFEQCLGELIELTGAELPREWMSDHASRARKALRLVFSARLAGPEWFEALLRAAIHDPNPSFNRVFVEPMLAAYGRRRVQSALIERIEHGSCPERAGAARAWYWADVLSRPDSDYTAQPLRPDYGRCPDLSIRWRQTALRVFVTDDDPDVRRNILPSLPLATAAYPVELHPLVHEAIRVARTSSDEYLRHRVEHQVSGCESSG